MMKLPFSVLASAAVTIALMPVSLAFADGDDCFPEVGETLISAGAVPMGKYEGNNVAIVYTLRNGERVRVSKVEVNSTVQIWAYVVTENGHEGWVFSGYFSDIIHGRASLCP
jgi:hypothetical protein